MKPLIAAVLVFANAANAASSSVPGVEPLAGNANLLGSGIPPIPGELKSRVGQYLNTRSATVLDQSDDGGQLLISTRFGSTAQLHLVDHPLGDRQQITFTDEPITSAHFLPGDPRIIFYGQDVGGGEFFQWYRLDRRTGRSELLTDGKSRHDSFILSRDGKRLAYSGTGRNGTDTDVYIGETANPRDVKRLTELPGTWHPMEFSPTDSTQMLVAQQRSSRDADLHLVNTDTGEKRQLTPKLGTASVHWARFTPDGKGVYLITDRGSNFDELYRIDLRNPEAAPRALSRSVPWDVEAVAIAPDGTRVAIVFNEDGFSRVRLLDARTGTLTPVELPKGVIGGIHFPRLRSDRVTFTLQTPRSPADAWRYDLKARKLSRWTHSETGGLSEASFVEPSLVRCPSTDGVSVPAWIYRPAQRGAEKTPLIIVWHGGPEGQSRPTFSPFVQLLAAQLGSAVLLPNVRGSSGYGKAYLDMDNGVKREASLADIGATLDWTATQPDLDPARVGVYGGSYGGYMVLATAAFFPNRIRAAVDVVGISRLSTLLSNTSPYRQDLRRAEYGDERIPEVRAVLERISPLNKVDAIEAALFVQQGKNDPRVPMSESEQIVKAMRARGKDVWYLLAENEGHGFRKKENQDFATQATVLFFRQTLLGSGTARLPAPPDPAHAIR
jgi:dipeptidyl aminopeptidase/acylaminoacyl peptidase